MTSTIYFNTEPHVRLNFDDSYSEIPTNGSPDEVAVRINAAINGEKMPTSITLYKPSMWPPGMCYIVTETLLSLACNVPVSVNGHQHDDMYQASVAAIAPPNDPTQHERSICNAIEAAAVFHPGGAKAAAEQIRQRIKDVGGATRSVNDITRDIQALAIVVDAEAEPVDLKAQGLAQKFLHDLSPEQNGMPTCIYPKSSGCYYIYSDGKWSTVNDEDMQVRVTRFLHGVGDVNVTRTLFKDVAANLKSLVFLDDGGVQPPYWIEQSDPLRATKPLLVQFSNGILHLGKLLGADGDAEDGDGIDIFEFDQDFYEGSDPRYLNTNVLPYSFDPDATCPGWQAMLDTVLPRESDGDHRQEVLQEFLGYTLLNGLNPFEAMLIMVGGGRNGKSTVMRVWQAMLGDHNVSHVDFGLLGKDAMLHSMVGKLANFTGELTHMSKPNEATLKQIISGEKLTIDRKYLTPITVAIYAKLVVACNMLPTISDTSDGVWRRLLIMPFNVKIPAAEVNPHLAEELKAELPGIFMWAVEGLRRLMRARYFTECEVCDNQKAEHRRDSNTVAEFLDQACHHNPPHAVTTKGLYRTYRKFTEDNGRLPISNTYFGREMKRLGYGKARVGAVVSPSRPWAYTGVFLNSEGLDAARRSGMRDMEIEEINVSHFQQIEDDSLEHPDSGDGEDGNEPGDVEPDTATEPPQ